MRRESRLILLAFFLSACGEDPVLSAAREEAEGTEEAAQTPVQATQTSAASAHPIDGGLPGADGPGEAGEPAPGVPEEPVPGDPMVPPPEGMEAPEPGDPSEPPPAQDGGTPPDLGPTVRVSGTIHYPGYTVGFIKLDVFDGDHDDRVGARPGLVTTVNLERPGAFQLQIPIRVPYVWLEASNDENQDGRPGPRDPSGRYRDNPVSTKHGDVAGIEIVLQKREAPGGGQGEL